jgi:hypothetical protein
VNIASLGEPGMARRTSTFTEKRVLWWAYLRQYASGAPMPPGRSCRDVGPCAPGLSGTVACWGAWLRFGEGQEGAACIKRALTSVFEPSVEGGPRDERSCKAWPAALLWARW